TALDVHGRALLACDAPFKDPGLRAKCTISWKVDVTGPDGQTITGGVDDTVAMNDVTLGVRSDSSTGTKNIGFDLTAVPRVKGQPASAEVQADLYLVQTKSVKERLGPFIYRYRNTDEYVPVEQKHAPANGRLAYEPKTPGRYVLVVSPLAGQAGITVSDEIYLSGDDAAQVPVKTDETLTVKPVREGAFSTGQTAAFDVLAPSGGIAWITVETDHVLDTFTKPLPGNSSRIEIPVQPGYVPNAHVSVYLLRPGHNDDLPGEMYGSCEFLAENPSSSLKLEVTTAKPEYEPRQTASASVRVTSEGKPVRGAEVTFYAVDDAILTLGDWALPELLPVFFPSQPFSVVTHAALTNYLQSITESMLSQKGVVVGGGGKDDFGNSRFVRENFKPLILWLPAAKTDASGVATAKFDTPDNLTRFRVIALAQTKQDQFGAGDATFTVSKPLIVEPALPRFLRQGDEIELRAVARQKASDGEQLTIRCLPGPGLTLIGSDSIEKTAAKNEPTVAVFRAKVDADAVSAPVKFEANSASGLNDSVAITLPVASRTITVHESIGGSWTGGKFAPKIPGNWNQASGDADITVSTSPYLTKFLGIPTILEYPHGCFEQKSSRLLVYTALGKLLAFLPQPEERAENYQKVIRKTLGEFSDSLLPDNTLPYWPYGTVGNGFVTIQSAWAVAQAQQAGFDIPERLANDLPDALEQMAMRKSRIEVSPTLRAFALGVLSQLQPETNDDRTSAAGELFLNRDHLTDEGRAMLAIALHTWDLEPEHQKQLIRDLPKSSYGRDFDPTTFSSGTRAEAICTWARLLVTPNENAKALKDRLSKLMESSASLSTQENLWLLIAFNALLDQKPAAKLSSDLGPAPNAYSGNQSAAVWTDRELARIHDFTISNLAQTGSYVVAASRSLTPAEQVATSRGMQIERIVKNLTDPTRTGTKDAPFKLGDQVLISFRFHCDKPQSYVAVEDALPAGLEVVNPNLEMIGKFYRIPDDPVPAAWLSFSEMRDQQTNLYFDDLPAGEQAYAILARATAAGTFAWPSTQITPMYDSRFYARTAPSTCAVVSE
ncbi:MAG TPA: alpha-2-macroglobulin family protein, partial [Chthoniobacterales bacterium]|nr:alpha-2-macroglobulin family protein [Chthoniobacterales bacterium]